MYQQMFNHKKATTMKRNIILTLALAATLTAGAQTWKQTDPNVRVYIEIDSDTKTDLQLGLCFENKTSLPMTAMGCYLDLPGSMSIISYQRGGVQNSGHTLSVKRDQKTFNNRWFITSYCLDAYANSYVNRKQFVGDGRVATLTLDASKLSEGLYTIFVYDAEVVWTDGYDVKSYKTADFSLQFQLKDGISQAPVTTDIQGVNDKDSKPAASGPEGIYTLQGVKGEKTQPGHISINNGRKVMAK